MKYCQEKGHCVLPATGISGPHSRETKTNTPLFYFCFANSYYNFAEKTELARENERFQIIALLGTALVSVQIHLSVMWQGFSL